MLHVITALPVGGTQMILLKLLQQVDRRDMTMRVVSLANLGEVGQRIRSENIEVQRLGMNESVISWHRARHLNSILSDFKPHVLQTWLYHADLLGALFGKGRRIPAIAWNVRCSSMGSDYANTRGRFLLKALASLSSIPSAIVCNSTAGKNWHVSKGYRDDTWHIIPNGFNTGDFRPDAKARARIRLELGIPDASPVVGLVARYDPIKGHSVFLNAATKLLADGVDAHFLVVGEGCTLDNRHLSSLRASAPSPQKIHLLGKREDIASVTAALDIATCTSFGEGFPNTLGEAMACGVPCVASDVGDCRDILAAPDLMFQPGDSMALAGALARLISTDELALRSLGQVARARIAEHYSLSTMADRYTRLYERLVANTV